MKKDGGCQPNSDSSQMEINIQPPHQVVHHAVDEESFNTEGDTLDNL